MIRSSNGEVISDGDLGECAVSDNVFSSAPVRSEFLCFVVDKSRVLPMDDLAHICVTFYREDEIFAARDIVRNAGHRLSKRQGSDKLKATVKDIIKAVLDPNHSLPVCYATDLSRLPPVDVKHCDMSAILSELQGLRSELRSMSHLQDEVATLRQQVEQTSTQLAELQRAKQSAVNSVAQAEAGRSSDNTASEPQASTTSFARLAENLKKSGLSARPKVVRRPVIGSSTQNQRLASVKTFRCVDVFVSRLHPSTNKQELINCVNEVKHNLSVEDVTCTQLKSRYEHLYASFCLSIRVDATDMKKAIDQFLSPDSWPMGVLVRRYFKPRDGQHE